MKNLAKELVKNYVASVGATLGMFTAIVMWGSGLGELIDEKSKKIFSKKNEEES